MMSYLEICGLDHPGKISIKPVTLCCSCCLIESVSLIDATNCEHYNSYKKLFDKTVTPNSSYICLQCHAVLMKILKFIAMVDDSEYVLRNRLNKSNKHNHFQFQITKLQNMDLKLPEAEFLIKTESIDIEFKTEPEDYTDPIDDAIQSADDNIDTTHEISYSKDGPEAVKDLVEELILPPVPDEWKGKIDYIHLTADQIAQEKAEITKQPSFLQMEFKCYDCALGFVHEFSYADHMDNRHVKRGDCILCDLCKSFVKNQNAKRHLLSHYARWQCCVCGIMFKTKRAICTHYKNHERVDGPEFKCDVCAHVAGSYRSMLYHKKKHRSNQVKATFECEHCKKCFVSRSSWKIHKEALHSNAKKIYDCHFCKKKFSRKNKLLHHVKHSHGYDGDNLAHICDICKIPFKTKYIMQEHMKAHSRRFQCDDCGQLFKRKTEITDHILSKHMKSAELICKICSKMFSTRKTLSIHVKGVHEKVVLARNKICDYCGKTFTNASILKQHLNTHTGARPFVCKYCGANFGHKAALYTHTRLVHLGGKKKSELTVLPEEKKIM